MKKLPDETTLNAWVLLHRTHRKLQESVESALKAGKLPPLDWYDVLLELHRAGNAGLRQFEIGDKVVTYHVGGTVEDPKVSVRPLGLGR